jgi:hypothetical protein
MLLLAVLVVVVEQRPLAAVTQQQQQQQALGMHMWSFYRTLCGLWSSRISTSWDMQDWV